MKHTVYHRRAGMFRTEGREDAQLVVVATVEAADYEEVFQLTNTIDRPWWKNEGVTPACPWGARSTSVGDEIEREDGERVVVAGCGFDPVTVGR